MNKDARENPLDNTSFSWRVLLSTSVAYVQLPHNRVAGCICCCCYHRRCSSRRSLRFAVPA